ncbi:hypothetical protein OG579_02890 [Williamsia herbipolensis]|uniref:Uncharacterized protein n=1 Tax=Williamsia herbipolensis TaxID=1603258 RepID=A0AAU4K3Y8_9NOCA|nr:hypothetical protein [Williamsia herbipolensis]
MTTASPGPCRTRQASSAAATSWFRPLVWLTAVMIVWAIVSAIGVVVDHRALGGEPIWAKPLKFSVSLAAYSITLAWMLEHIDKPRLRRIARFAATGGSAAALTEITIISVQVIRGIPSHFNVSTALNSALYSVMGAGAVVLFMTTAVVGCALAYFTTLPDRSIQWSLRWAVPIALAGLSVGFVMIIPTAQQATLSAPRTLGTHSIGGDDTSGGLFLLGWNTMHGDLRIAHFVGMHALQALPLIALALAVSGRHRLGERTRLEIVSLISTAWAALTAITLWQALRGQSVVNPDALTWAVVAALAGYGVVAIIVILARSRHRRCSTSARERRSVTTAEPTPESGRYSAAAQKITASGSDHTAVHRSCNSSPTTVKLPIE